jgi:hypothetical protein
MRRFGLFKIPEGGDFGILWPLIIAAKELPQGELRSWAIDFLKDWPSEVMNVSPIIIEAYLHSILSMRDSF